MAKKKFKTKYKKNKRLKTKPITRKDGIKQRYWVKNPNYFTKEISLEQAKEVHENKSKLKKLQYFHSIDCKDPERTLKYINSEKVNKRLNGLVDWHHWEEIEEEYNVSPNDDDYEFLLTFYHIKEFIDYTGIEGDKGVFLATNSCEDFDLFLEELKEVENEEGETIGYNFWEDEELLFKWRYNEDGYLTEV